MKTGFHDISVKKKFKSNAEQIFKLQNQSAFGYGSQESSYPQHNMAAQHRSFIVENGNKSGELKGKEKKTLYLHGHCQYE